MPNANDMIADRQISMLLKGPYGFGKTLAACSVAVEGPIFLAYFDKKQPVELLNFFKRHRPELLKNITYEVFGAHNANQYINRLIEFTRRCDYVAVITDSATNLTASAVNWSLGFRNPAGPKKDSLNATAVQLIPDFDEYKVETSLVTQAIDIGKSLPAHMIWTAHPLPSLKVEGSGKTMSVTKVNNIVTYGSKAGAIIPGNFSEVYHFSLDQTWDGKAGKMVTRRMVNPAGVGDDFGRSSIGLTEPFDITDRLFWEVWRDEIKKLNGGVNEVK